MTTEVLHCMELAGGRLFARAASSNSELQVILDGKEIATFHSHLNQAISFSPQGLALYNNGYSNGNHVVNLNDALEGRELQARRVGAGETLHPGGQEIWGFTNPEYSIKDPVTGEQFSRLTASNLKTGRLRQVWSGSGRNPREHVLFDQQPAILQEPYEWDEKPGDEITIPQMVIAEDGHTWALAATKRVVLGRDDQTLACFGWRDIMFYPPAVAFTPDGQRLILAGKKGMVAFNLAGDKVAEWHAIRNGDDSDAIPVVSPPVFYKGDLLAVICIKGGIYSSRTPKTFEVWRFDPQTLQPLGRLEGMPRRRDPQEWAALLPMSDGSLAWVPDEQPITVLPSPECQLKASTLVRVVGQEPPPRVPVPDADWYDPAVGAEGDLAKLTLSTPGQRKSLARFFLNDLMEDDRFEDLLKFDPEAFKPYADGVLGWKLDWLSLLRKMDRRWYFLVARGASDEAVDALTAKIVKKLPKISEEQVMLLIGAGTPRALEHLAELARKSAKVDNLCIEFFLAIPESGPAVMRFVPQFMEVVGYKVNRKRRNGDGEDSRPTETQPGLAYPLDHADFLPEKTGWGCKQPLAHLLTLSLDLLPGKPLASSPLPVQHWFITTCEDCDESICVSYESKVITPGQPQVALFGNAAQPGKPRPPADDHCEGGELEPPEDQYILRLEPYNPDRDAWRSPVLAHIGGYPEWWQQPEIPGCPKCQSQMFYVGQVTADALRNDVADAALYGFHCEYCGTIVQIVQIT